MDLSGLTSVITASEMLTWLAENCQEPISPVMTGTDFGIIMQKIIDVSVSGSFDADITVNTVTVGQGGKSYSEQSQNTVLGNQALLAGTTGYANTAVGYEALIANTTSHDNVAVGAFALTAQTTGRWNTAIGSSALKSATTDDENTAVGYGALGVTAGGTGFNTAVGTLAGGANTTGDENVFIGAGTGKANTTGHSNTYVGALAGENSTGDSNVFIGDSAGKDEMGTAKFYLSTRVDRVTTYDLLKGDFLTGQLTLPVVPVTSAGIYNFLTRDTVTGNIEVSSLTPEDSSDLLLFNAQTASYTLVLADTAVAVDNASANTITIPSNASVAFPLGKTIAVWQKGTGQITLTPGAGVTIQSAGAATKTRVQHSVATLIKIDTDTWLLSGDIAA